MVLDIGRDVCCQTPSPEPCLSGDIQNSPRALGNGPSNNQLFTLPASLEATCQKSRNKLFTLLEPDLQTYNDPSIVEWYKSRGASPETGRAPTTGRTSDDYHGFAKTQSSHAPDQYPIQATNESPTGPAFGFPEESTTGHSRIGSDRMEVGKPKQLPLQSLLNSTQTDERPSKGFGNARLGDGNIEDLVLDGLGWLSSYAP